MKAGWKLSELADLCDVFTDGNWIETKDQSQEGIRLVQTGNVGLGIFKDRKDKARFISEETFDALKCFEVLPGDCLISRLPDPVGRACEIPVTEERMITAVDCSIVRADPHKMDKNYFIYFSQSWSYLNDVDKACSGTTRRRISRKNLGKIRIPLPPLDEQQRIVSILDKAFEGLDRARENAEANLESARELFVRSISYELFKDQSIPMRNVADVAEHSLGKMLDKSKNQGTLRPYLRNVNVRWFYIDTSDLLEMKIKETEIKRYSIRKGDLLICEGGYPGRCSIWHNEEITFFQKALHRVRFEHEAYAKLLMLYLFLQDQTGELSKHFTGTGIQHFTGKALANFQMPFPEVSLADKITKRIEAIQLKSDLTIARYTSKLQDISELRQSLLQKAFAGELT